MAMTSTIKGKKICCDCGKEFEYRSPKAQRCPECRKEYQRRHARMRYSPTGEKIGYSQSGENNNHWRGGESQYYRQFQKDCCERCGSTRYLVVHHRDRNRRNNDSSNLETLCKSCHQREHECWKNFTKGIVGSKEK